MSEWNDSTPVSEPQKAAVSEPNVTATPSPSKPKKVNGVLVGIIVLLLGVVGVLAYAVLRPEPEEVPMDGRATFVTPENVEEVRQKLAQGVKDAYYKTSMTIDWYFDNSKAVSTTAYVANHEDNTRTVYFDVNLENGELVYSSPYLPVGAKLQQFALDKELDAGDYPAVCTYYLVDDDHKVLTRVSVAVTIHILN